MKMLKIIILSSVILFSYSLKSYAEDCTKFDKLSKEYASCTANIIKNKTSNKIKESKKLFSKSKLKEKFLKFKNSKSHQEFTKD